VYFPMVNVEEFEKKEGVAATFEEDSNGDLALLSLANRPWFKIFLVISISLSLSEPFLVAFPDQTYLAQKIVLAASTLLFFFGYGATMAAMTSGSFFKRFRDAFLPEVWIEIVCFVFGWALIFEDPAIACLRCFRIFRFVWYSEFYRARKGSIFFPLTFFCHTVLQYCEKVGRELFTTSSKGGVIVLGFFFYLAYVVGVSFWQKTANLDLVSPEGGSTGVLSECDTLPHCFLIMLRLTFWDGSGFDFLKSVMDYGDQGLVTLLIFYMCFSAMVLLNGLIGIFGGAFASATEEDDDDDDDDKKDVKELVEVSDLEKEDKRDLTKALDRIEQLCRKLEADIIELKNNYK